MTGTTDVFLTPLRGIFSMGGCDGGAGGNFWERNFDLLELAKKFTELKFSLDCITMILNSQVEKKDNLIL